MRFAFLVNNYPPRTGGVETHVHSLALALKAAGHEILVVTVGGGPIGIGVEDGLRVVRLGERLRTGDVLGFPPLGTRRQLSRLLAEENIDVVSVHTRFFPMTWLGLRAAHRNGIPVIHTEHGSGHVVSSSPLISVASRLVDHTLGRSVLRRADEVVGVSENVTAFVRRLSGRQARVFYNAIEPPMTAGGGGQDGTRVVFVGRLVPGKGGDVFVDTVAELAARGIAVAATLLGDGPERDALARRIEEHRLSATIEMRGRVSPAEVRAELAGAVLVNPTVLAEGFQTTLLEALAEGGRVVTYDVPGAAVLRDQGHPVTIVRTQVAAELATAVASVLSDLPAPVPLEGWYWRDRAAEFVALATEVVARGAARSRG